MAPDEMNANARNGMLAAAECCRIQHTAMAQALQAGSEQERLSAQAAGRAAVLSARADAGTAGLDLEGALIAVTLRAASLAASVVDGMTVPKFLHMLEAEVRGWQPPGQD